MTDNTRKAAANILFEFFKNNTPVSEAMNVFRKESSMEARDIRFVNEIVNGTLRNLDYIDYIIAAFSSIKLNKISAYILCVLRVSSYQILFMDKIPHSAAVNEAVKLAKKSNYRVAGFVNAILRKISQEAETVVLPADKKKYISTRYSYPEWIVDMWYDRLGDEAEQLALAMNQKPDTFLRVNTLRTSADELAKILNNDGWKCNVYSSKDFKDIDYLICAQKIESITSSQAYRDGLFYIQDSAACYAAHILSPKENDTVLDMCASPGGKTTHLAQIMNNKGKVIAFDVSENKIERIRQNAQRLGINCIEAMVWDSTVPKPELEGSADCILVDAPCSGLGIIRKKPDIKYSRKPEDISALAKISLDILSVSARYLKSKGKLVFSTCTTTQEENEGVLFEFLRLHPEFHLVPIDSEIENEGYITLYPHRNCCDGFFISLLTKD